MCGGYRAAARVLPEHRLQRHQLRRGDGHGVGPRGDRDHPPAPRQDPDQRRHRAARLLRVQHQLQRRVPGHGPGGGAAKQVSLRENTKYDSCKSLHLFG